MQSKDRSISKKSVQALRPFQQGGPRAAMVFGKAAWLGLPGSAPCPLQVLAGPSCTRPTPTDSLLTAKQLVENCVPGLSPAAHQLLRPRRAGGSHLCVRQTARNPKFTPWLWTPPLTPAPRPHTRPGDDCSLLPQTHLPFATAWHSGTKTFGATWEQVGSPHALGSHSRPPCQH